MPKPKKKVVEKESLRPLARLLVPDVANMTKAEAARLVQWLREKADGFALDADRKKYAKNFTARVW